MCSLGGLAQLKTQLARFHYSYLTTSNGSLACSNGDDDMIEWCAGVALLGRLAAYITVSEFDDVRSSDEVRATETSLLRPGKIVSYWYGGCHGKDLESGDCSSSSSSSNGYSEELYDGKVCVICYDEERNCFFVPCGHCATCYGVPCMSKINRQRFCIYESRE